MIKKEDIENQSNIIFHIDYKPTPECNNPNTFGEVCLKCNDCQRFTKLKPTKYGIKYDTKFNSEHTWISLEEAKRLIKLELAYIINEEHIRKR